MSSLSWDTPITIPGLVSSPLDHTASIVHLRSRTLRGCWSNWNPDRPSATAEQWSTTRRSRRSETGNEYGGELSGIDVLSQRCNWQRGARPSRSLCSASRRTADAADSNRRLLRLCECCRPVDGTSTEAVETTALPISRTHPAPVCGYLPNSR